MEKNRRTEAKAKKDVERVLNQAQMSAEISKALQPPFPILGSGSAAKPLVSDDGGGDCAVFANYHPRKSELTITRALRRKLKASYEVDDLDYFDGQRVTTFDLKAKSGKWPESTVESDPEEGEAASVRHRLVLFETDEPIGFCTVEFSLRRRNGTTGIELGVEVRAVFVEPKHRGRWLSVLFAEGVGVLAVDLVKQFASRLQGCGAGGSCPVKIVFEGEAISEGGVWFSGWVEKHLEDQFELAGLDDSGVVHRAEVVRSGHQG